MTKKYVKTPLLKFTKVIFNFRLTYTQESIDWADVIIPIGGDGTFLLASCKVRDDKKPVIGLNSDPTRSEGYLCLPKYYTKNLKEAFEKLQTVKLKFH